MIKHSVFFTKSGSAIQEIHTPGIDYCCYKKLLLKYTPY